MQTNAIIPYSSETRMLFLLQGKERSPFDSMHAKPRAYPALLIIVHQLQHLSTTLSDHFLFDSCPFRFRHIIAHRYRRVQRL